MTVARRSLTTFGVSCLLVLVAQALIVSLPTSGVSSPSSCSQLRRWADTYRNTSPTLDRIVSFDRAHRVALLSALPAETQAALWREHLRRFSQRADLSDVQRQLIVEGISLTVPALYRHDAAANQALDEFWVRAKFTFSTRTEALPWFDMGRAAEKQSHPTSLLDRLVAPFRAEAGTQWCECTTSWTEIFCPGSCVTSGCTFTNGCGLDGRSICNGMCQ